MVAIKVTARAAHEPHTPTARTRSVLAVFIAGESSLKRNSLTRQRLAALALLGAPLLLFPLVALPEGDTGGVPNVVIYLFGVWAALIGLAIWVAERSR